MGSSTGSDRRKSLLVVRAGNKSLHERWLSGCRGEPRLFDLHISYFGDSPNPWPDRDDDISLTTEKGTKFQGLLQCLEKIDDRIAGYDYVGFPDDDLIADCATWNRFTQILLEFRPALAQPALSTNSFFSHDILLRRRQYQLRWTNFIELMCPFFERDSLSLARQYFGENESGWGLDHLWREILGAKKRKLCVVDETPILHTRAVGTGPLYKSIAGSQLITPWQEMQNLVEKYGLEYEADRVYAGVRRTGELVDGADYQARALLTPRIRRRLRRILSINQIG